jgi:5'-3' exonuclease
MDLYIVDGTYELFRAHFGYPSRKSNEGKEVGALKGYINHLQSLRKNNNHLCVSFDSTVESFRNQLFTEYKSSNHIDPEILQQFPLAEEVTELLGITLLSMKEYEADDGIASVCSLFENEFNKIIIGSLDKDLMQCVKKDKIIMYSTRYKNFTNENGVFEKFGVSPEQIPDFLALIGDSSDGIPGMKGIGQKTAAELLQKYNNIEAIYENIKIWKSNLRGGARHSETISENYKLLQLFKDLTTLRTDVEVPTKTGDYQTKDINIKGLEKFSNNFQLNINL